MTRFAFATILALAGCGTASPGGMGGPNMNNKVGGGNEVSNRSEVVSWDILEREPVANEVKVRHILVGWKSLADAYGGRMDPRAEARTSRKEAEQEVTALLGKINAGADFEKTMVEHSEDPGTARAESPLNVTPDAGLVIEFRLLSLRLQQGEVGVCQSDYGFHIIKRML
jgi:hypothetical protein